MVRIPLHDVPDGPRLPGAGPETPSCAFLPGRLPALLRISPLLPGFPAHQRCQVLRSDARAVRGDRGFPRRGHPYGSTAPGDGEGISFEVGEPEDIGRAAVRLASDASDHVSGTSRYIDGGMTIFPEFYANG